MPPTGGQNLGMLNRWKRNSLADEYTDEAEAYCGTRKSCNRYLADLYQKCHRTMAKNYCLYGVEEIKKRLCDANENSFACDWFPDKTSPQPIKTRKTTTTTSTSSSDISNYQILLIVLALFAGFCLLLVICALVLWILKQNQHKQQEQQEAMQNKGSGMTTVGTSVMTSGRTSAMTSGRTSVSSMPTKSKYTTRTHRTRRSRR